jgi:magnesium chelatase accessory protein
MSDAPQWEIDGADWPNREHSRFVDADGLAGTSNGRVVGRQSSCSTALGLLRIRGADFPLLMPHFDVIAPICLGMVSTQTPRQIAWQSKCRRTEWRKRCEPCSIPLAPNRRSAVGELGRRCCLLIRMVTDQGFAPGSVFCINGALLPFEGIPGAGFSAGQISSQAPH